MHCATDTFGHHGARNKGADDPYIQMIGAEFIVHGAQQPSRIDIVGSRVSRESPTDSVPPAAHSRSPTNGMPSKTSPMICT